jgi:hypothetical protein
MDSERLYMIEIHSASNHLILSSYSFSYVTMLYDRIQDMVVMRQDFFLGLF